MNKVYALWAVKIGDPDPDNEVFIGEFEQTVPKVEDEAELNKAKNWAAKSGFTKLRVSTLNPGDMPDFKGAVNVKCLGGKTLKKVAKILDKVK